MKNSGFPRLAAIAALLSALLTTIFAVLLVQFRGDLRRDIRTRIIERDAAVLYRIALLQIADAASSRANAMDSDLLTPVLHSAQLEGMLAVSVFDADGNSIRSVPSTLLFVDLPVDDYFSLTRLKPISRFHPQFRLDQTFISAGTAERHAPVLEVLVPLHRRGETQLAGVARYYMDARPLAEELAATDGQIGRQTAATIGIGGVLITLVVALGYVGLRRAELVIAERNERLTRSNFELTLAVKTSALGQITSHLIHGLQGPVSGLRAMVTGRDASTTSWETAADYTGRMQTMIQDAVALLGDTTAQTTYALTESELVELVRSRHAAMAAEKEVTLTVAAASDATVDSHRGGILCLIVGNLIQNAIQASKPAGKVQVDLRSDPKKIAITVADDGPGIAAELLPRLFQVGQSGRGGTGLGLAISQLLARQIGAELSLESTGPSGTVFSLVLPLESR